jgi:hypothetical protein
MTTTIDGHPKGSLRYLTESDEYTDLMLHLRLPSSSLDQEKFVYRDPGSAMIIDDSDQARELLWIE